MKYLSLSIFSLKGGKMRTIALRLMIATLLFLFIVPLTQVSAQDDQPLTTVVDLSDGYIISVPDGWEFEEDEDTGGVVLSDGTIVLFVLNPVKIADLVEVDEDADADDLLIDLYDELYNDRPRRRDIEETEIGEREAVRWAYEDDSFGSEGTGIFYVIRLSNNLFGAVEAYIEDGDILDSLELIETIITSFDAGADAQVAAAEPCFISTDEEETVELRVGPGTNRSVMAFLEADEEFQVIGRFTADDGDVWYQLDKEEVLPGTAANELWVAADAVDETGDCDAVVDASAPPIVPISNQPPSDNTGDGGGDTGGGTTGGATGGVLPSTGTWTVYLDATTTASCLNSNTITLDTSDVYISSSFRINISSVASDGASMVVSGDTFIRQPNGLYVGSFTFSDGSNTQMYLAPSTSTSMGGQIIFNFTLDDGRACSATTNISASR
jgi:hypothetical protein